MISALCSALHQTVFRVRAASTIQGTSILVYALDWSECKEATEVARPWEERLQEGKGCLGASAAAPNAYGEGTLRGGVHKLKQERFRLDLRKNFFTLKAVRAAQRGAISIHGGFQATTG